MKFVHLLMMGTGLICAAALSAPLSDAAAQQPPAVGNSVINGGPYDLGNGNYGWTITTSEGIVKEVVTNSRGGIRHFVNGVAPAQAYLPPPAPPPVFESNGVPPIPTHQPGWMPQQAHGNNVPTVKRDQPAAKLDHPAGDHNSSFNYGGGGAGFGLAGFGIYEIVHHNNAGK